MQERILAEAERRTKSERIALSRLDPDKEFRMAQDFKEDIHKILSIVGLADFERQVVIKSTMRRYREALEQEIQERSNHD